MKTNFFYKFIFIILIISLIFVTYKLISIKPDKNNTNTSTHTQNTQILNQIKIYIYFPSQDGNTLKQISFKIINTKNKISKITNILNLLFSTDAEKYGCENLFKNRFKLINLFLNKKKLYINLFSEPLHNKQWSSNIEIMIIKSIAKTIKKNLPDIKSIQFLIDNQPAETFDEDKCHISIKNEFKI